MLQVVENPEKLGYSVKSTGIWHFAKNQPSSHAKFPNTQKRLLYTYRWG